jgi:hypothetical protein
LTQIYIALCSFLRFSLGFRYDIPSMPSEMNRSTGSPLRHIPRKAPGSSHQITALLSFFSHPSKRRHASESGECGSFLIPRFKEFIALIRGRFLVHLQVAPSDYGTIQRLLLVHCRAIKNKTSSDNRGHRCGFSTAAEGC